MNYSLGRLSVCIAEMEEGLIVIEVGNLPIRLK